MQNVLPDIEVAQKGSTSTDSRDTTYFSYYSQFVHQQNMLQDTVRTSLYQTAILANGPTLFAGKTVMDLGAGSGILSYLAVRAGASHVFAVEASGMADKVQKLIDYAHTTNHWMLGKLTVIKSKIEDVENLPKVDTLISEPIGVLLVHERMLESYILARDRFLKPNGVMVPSMGTMYVAPFSDSNLWSQTMAKVRFWEQQDFFGIDFSPLGQDAKDEIFGQPVVGGFDARTLVAPACSHVVDFRTVTAEELKDIIIPFTWMATFTGLIHGIGAWFDINLAGYVLSTAPHAEKTHWHQVRLLLKEPLAVNAFETIRGWIRFVANPMRSYYITAEMVVGNQGQLSNPRAPLVPSNRAVPDGFTRRIGKWALHEQTYYFDQYPADTIVRPEFVAGLTAVEKQALEIIRSEPVPCCAALCLKSRSFHQPHTPHTTIQENSKMANWEGFWSNNNIFWDLNATTPAVAEFLRDHPEPLGESIIVPGCGLGHDCIAFAEAGYKQVVGVDIAPSGMAAAIKHAASKNAPASLQYETADFFAMPHERKFDMLFDYTFACAIDPSLRDAWQKQVAAIVKPGGHALVLMFPLGEKPVGPPFGWSIAEYVQRLEPYFELVWIKK
eukprot:jgi/Hompol1/4883/HPOL_004023-RA